MSGIGLQMRPGVAAHRAASDDGRRSDAGACCLAAAAGPRRPGARDRAIHRASDRRTVTGRGRTATVTARPGQ
jgi:hypothetical protein